MDQTVYRALTTFDLTQRAVLCSLLAWKGSVPRKDYPLMLVPQQGRPVGTIGGGSLEHAVIKAARQVLKSGESRFERYQLDQTDVAAPGGICGGQVQVLIEPLTEEIQSLWQAVGAARQTAQPIVVITEVSESPVWSVRHYLAEKRSIKGLPAAVLEAVEAARRRGRSRSLDTPQGFFLVRCLPPAAILHIFGAGHVAHAVARLADFIEMGVKIYDDRRELANHNRFPTALAISNLEPTEAVAGAAIAPGDLVLVLVREHRHDLVLLQALLGREWSYLGLISSKVKWRLLAEKLQEQGYSPERLAQVQAPVGLAIQSETVPEIAVSIIAEIIKHLRSGERSQPAVIHRK